MEDESASAAGDGANSTVATAAAGTKSGRFTSVPVAAAEDLKIETGVGNATEEEADEPAPQAAPNPEVVFEITSEDSGNEDDISDSIKQDVEIIA